MMRWITYPKKTNTIKKCNVLVFFIKNKVAVIFLAFSKPLYKRKV
jgi:hypothetical protein